MKTTLKHIIFITGQNSKVNTTLQNIKSAASARSMDLIVVDPDECKYDERRHVLMSEGKDYNLEDFNSADTIVFIRLKAIDNPTTRAMYDYLSTRGFISFNPISSSEIACDKCATALFLDQHNIPQPKWIIISPGELSDKATYFETLKSVSKNPKESKFVFKIPSGHGGAGVFLLDGDSSYAVLQAFFATTNTQIIVQELLDNDGDLRVHVIKTRESVEIIGAMKRNKIDNDFRSNVSLGATTEKVTLSEAQKKICTDVSTAFDMPWCAVDLMHTKDDKDYVIEVNTSPGTAGISDVIGENIFNRILDIASTPHAFAPSAYITGSRTEVKIQWVDNYVTTQTCRLDTGNTATCSTVTVDKIDENEDDDTVTLTVDGRTLKYDVKRYLKVKNQIGRDVRPVIQVKSITIGDRFSPNPLIAVTTSRNHMSNQALISTKTMVDMGIVVRPDY